MFNRCEDKIDLINSDTVKIDLTNYEEIIDTTELSDESFVYVHDKDEPKKIQANKLARGVQSDWAVEDPLKPGYIKNKPNIDSSVLDKDLVVQYTVGGISKGSTFREGTSLMEIMKQMLESGFYRKIWLLACSTMPESLDNLPSKSYSDVDLLSEKGLDWHVILNNEYFVIGIERAKDAPVIKLTHILQGGWPLSFDSKQVGDADIYYYNYKGEPMKTTGEYDIHLEFATVQ